MEHAADDAVPGKRLLHLLRRDAAPAAGGVDGDGRFHHVVADVHGERGVAPLPDPRGEADRRDGHLLQQLFERVLGYEEVPVTRRLDRLAQFPGFQIPPAGDRGVDGGESTAVGARFQRQAGPVEKIALHDNLQKQRVA